MTTIALPNDSIATGYRKTGPFSFEQTFRSASTNFEGTENEFLAAGHAYRYIQIDKFTRREIPN